ncbi:hypothetical protein [Nocardia jinanensis]|uniref:PASTA domain-containing protein n=1 Tax=Nocardia jinanensis TaxID=382504 RepID=A0A917RQP4_9NOCA|nr:hypothetical protein [Nocardia jinanensis]GGL20008.1 hypothetical protein GCM10011588_38460 [Nocardia jinanensis]
MKRTGVCAIILSTAVLGGCGLPRSEAESRTPVPVPVQITSVHLPEPAVAPQPVATETAPPAANTSARVPMPAVVCMNLQAAQDLIQTAGVFYSRSADATGQGRRQVVDRNWVVVAQTPAPGALIGEGDAVLSVVKVGEPTDCY